MEDLLVKYESLLAELLVIEHWDSSYYRQEIHDAMDRDAHCHRRRRRLEILWQIVQMMHPENRPKSDLASVARPEP